MFCKNLCDKVSGMKKKLRWLFPCFFHIVHRCVLHFFDWHIFHGENHETKSPVLTFLKKNLKKAKSTGRNGCQKSKKHFFLLHPSSGAVRAGRFGTPNFFRRPWEPRLISWSPNDRFWSFSIIRWPKVILKSPVRFSTNPLASLGGLNNNNDCLMVKNTREGRHM